MVRIVDNDLLESYKGIPCVVCGSLVTVAHHLKTKGSGGDDVEENLMPLCFTHHREVHDKGLLSFSQKHESVKPYLELRGWRIEGFTNKWWRGTKEGYEVVDNE